MINVNIKIPDKIFISINENEEVLSQKIKLYTALELYKQSKLTLLQASELADLNLFQFLIELKEHNIDVIDYNPDELEKELEIFK